MHSYIYLLREREFFRLNGNIYKIGKTEQEPNNRLAGYPKGSEVVLFMNVRDCHAIEGKIIYIFKNIFKQRTDIGTEYFEGDRDYMIKIICDVINVNNDNINNLLKIDKILQEKDIIMFTDNKHNNDESDDENNTTITNNYKLNSTISKNNSQEIGLELNIKIPEKKIPNIMPNKEQQQNQYNGKQNKLLTNMKYNCVNCKYVTNDKTAWYIHKKTIKHLKSTEKLNENAKNNNGINVANHKTEQIELINKNHEIEILKEKMIAMENEKNLIKKQLIESTRQIEVVNREKEKRVDEINKEKEKRINEIKEHLGTLKYKNRFKKIDNKLKGI